MSQKKIIKIYILKQKLYIIRRRKEKQLRVYILKLKKLYKVVQLFGGGSVINGATPPSV